MSRILDYVLEPNVVYTNGAFLIKVKVQDDYKYKKYLVSESMKYTTATGTTFTLTNAVSTNNASILQLQGNTSQTGTPTPTSPIEVKTVSGDNEVVVCGKNLFDKSTVTNGYRLDSSGNASSSQSNEFTSEYIAIAPNTTYIRSTGGVSAYTRTCFYDNSKTFISKDDSNQIITTPSNARYLRFSEYNSKLDTMQLEKRKCSNNLRALYW